MTQSPPPDASSHSDKPRARTVEELCQRFQAAYQKGKHIRIEDILERARLPESSRLLRGLLIVEISFLRRQGKNPSPAEYRARFPQETSVVDEVFTLLKESPPQNRPRPEKPPKSLDFDDIQVEVVQAGNRHRRPEPSSSRKPPVKKDPFDLEIVEVPAKRPPVSRSKPGANGKPPGRKAPAGDSMDEILSQMQPLSPRVKAVRDVDDEDDEDRPRVKKIKPKKKKQKKNSGESSNPMEFAVPLGLLIVSAITNLAFAAVFAPVGVPIWMYVVVKVGYILLTTAVTTAALFAAAMFLDTQYGYLNTGLVKIAAICLTQTWMAELALHAPAPQLIGFGVWAATFIMFMLFFQLSLFEALASMGVVRVAHNLAYMFIFLSLVSFYRTGGRTGLEEAAIEAADNHIAAKLKEEEKPVPPEYDQLVKKFGDALMQEKYADAYTLMSEPYRQQTTLEKFTEIHKQARKEYGKPLQLETGVGTVDKDSLKDEEYGKLSEIPANVRRAWMNAQLALEVNDGEVDRCYDCWMLLIDDAGKLAVGRFEYHGCD